MVILSADEVRKALSMPDAIRAVRWAYVATSTGQAVMPKRLHLSPPGSSDTTLVMPSYVPASPDDEFAPSLAVKTVSVFGGNAAKGLPSVLGGVLVLDPATGAGVALIDGASLTAIRTGAGAAVATDALALPEADTLAVIGAGGQAASQIEAICCVRPIRSVWIYDRNPDRAESLREQARGFATEIIVAGTAAEAVRHAAIVCTVTTSESPVFEPDDLMPGCHINAMGSFRPNMQEIPAEAVRQAKVYVDHLASALHEAGDLVIPISAGIIDERHVVGEIGQLLAGQIPGRSGREEITIFKSVGMATQDAVCATVAVRRAEELGLGTTANLA